ncbi:MAG: deoxyribodipyrimidine photo-lyase [Pseudomonadota bacterium]
MSLPISADPNAPIIVWFRQDLRLSDHEALTAACESDSPVIPLYVWDISGKSRELGSASRWWLHHSLAALSKDLDGHGSRLVIKRGEPLAILRDIIKETGARSVFWSRRYDAAERDIDATIKSALKDEGINAKSFAGHLLREPWTVRSKSDTPLKVFTPFWRAHSANLEPGDPLPVPKIPAAMTNVQSLTLDDLDLLPRKPDWSAGFTPVWAPGEAGARERLNQFLENVHAYGDLRNRPDIEGTSRLSPHLRFGEISPRQVWHAAMKHPQSEGRRVFLSEIGWREFSYNLLFYNPDIGRENIQEKFDAFPWREDNAALKAWQRGETGYPIVDAGMRQLWQTGWMHNRLRMIVGSFLVKHLLLDWRAGESWFWDTLVDADPASNTASWQWIAGTGADAAPYFRVFNPMTQGEKFDPNGEFVRRYCPEISDIPVKTIHKPWESGPLSLRQANITLGETYPNPIVDHAFGRQRALDAFQSLKKAS